MKKVILLAGILCVFNLTILKAQTEQGTFFLGMSSSMSLSGNGSHMMSLEFSKTNYLSDGGSPMSSNPLKTTSFNLLPKVGYFVTPNFALGLDLSLSLYGSKDNSGVSANNMNSTLLGAGPFIRYYIPAGKVFPFCELGSSLGTIINDTKYINKTVETSQSLLSIGGGVGAAILLGNHASFDVLLDYHSLTVKDKQDNIDNYRTVMGTLGLKVGFTIFFGRPKGKAVAL